MSSKLSKSQNVENERKSLILKLNEKTQKLMSECTTVMENREKMIEIKDALEKQNAEEQKKFEDEYENEGEIAK